MNDIVARIERLPLSGWHIRTRLVVGIATFFDAFDALSIAYVLPALIRPWGLQPGASQFTRTPIAVTIKSSQRALVTVPLHFALITRQTNWFPQRERSRASGQ